MANFLVKRLLRNILQITGELKDFNQQWAAKDNTNEKLLHDKLLHAKLMYEKFNANDFLSHPPMEGFPRVSIWKGFF